MDRSIHLVPFSSNPLVFAAEKIIDHYQAQLPDLGSCQILLADEQSAASLRACLLEEAEKRGFPALLGPSIDRLDQWLNRVTDHPGTVLGRAAQELVLAEALRNAAPIYADTDPWLLADQLLTLFNELSCSGIPIPDRLEDFEQQLKRGYGLDNNSPSLQQEALILHTLWQAWQQQLRTDHLLDGAGAYREQLQASLQLSKQPLWLIGFTEFQALELNWLRTRIGENNTCLILHGDAQHSGYHPDAPLHELFMQLALPPPTDDAPAADDFNRFIRCLFEPSEHNLRQRALSFSTRYPEDPVRGRLSILRTDSPELEARAVALEVRRCLLDDLQPVAILSEDLRLARRVRALLETSGIELDDTGGWALSTTSAAATLERWLETVEEDFACAPLLDVLKSPFLYFTDPGEHLAQVRRLEQDIILHENIARGLERYRHHLDLRSERLPDWSEPMRRSLHALLNRLDHAASPLMPLLKGKHPAADFLQALHESLEELGTLQCLAGDAAGQRVIEVLEELKQAATVSRVELDWMEFRNWLGRDLERSIFRSPSSASPVRLLTLGQSRLQQFAATIIAGCSREHLPGSPSGGAFFNQRVRSELQLPTWAQSLSGKLHHFCRALHSSKRVLLTWHSEQDGEPVSPSPWLELLEVFHRNAYRGTLHAELLAQLLTSAETQAETPDTEPLPTLQRCPRPRAPASIQPKTWSAYTHQRLIDCPYRFFAADTLRLKPQDEIREILSKNDYGSLVHRVLQAFHSKIAGLPGPWKGPLDENSRAAGLRLLEQISQAIFAQAVQENFQARSWLNQWRTILPHYLDWEIERRRHWQLRKVEMKAETDISASLRFSGRIDRIDQKAGCMGLLDYKTGRPPGRDAVLSGEAVQLPSYALMLEEPVSQLDYLELGKNEVSEQICAEGDELKQLLDQLGDRVRELDQALQQAAPLPAWGDEKVCGYCEFSGVCRRDMWQQGETADG